MQTKKVSLTAEYQKIILGISDLHCGHRYGLFPDNFELDEGNIIKINSGQRQLLEYWQNMIVKIREYKVDTVYIVGDVFAGSDPFERGIQLLTTNEDEQVRAAADLLEPVCQGRVTRIWSGTMAHENRTVKLHRYLVRELQVRGHNCHFESFITNMRVCKEPKSRVWNIAHETTGAVVYPESAMARDRMFLMQSQALGKLPKDISMIIRAHRHKYTHIDSEGIHTVVLPCWVMWYPYKANIRYYTKFQPDIGFVLFTIDTEARQRVIPFLYPTPHLVDRVKNEER